jgi:hypothetical protein
MDIKKIENAVQLLRKRFLSSRVEKELLSYSTFFSKSEIIQPVEDMTEKDILHLVSLCREIQTNRERVLVIYLGVKKAKNRLRLLEKDLLSNSVLYKKYTSLKNNEQRDLFIHATMRSLDFSKEQAKYLADSSEKIMELIDKHVGVLRDNMFALKPRLK